MRREKKVDPGSGLIVFLIGVKVEKNVTFHSNEKLTSAGHTLESSIVSFVRRLLLVV